MKKKFNVIYSFVSGICQYINIRDDFICKIMTNFIGK